MEITGRDDVYLVKATPKSKLLYFERKLYDLKEISAVELFIFLINQKCKMAYNPTFGAIMMGLKGLIKGKIDLEDMNRIGDPLECDFQYVKVKRRSSKEKQP